MKRGDIFTRDGRQYEYLSSLNGRIRAWDVEAKCHVYLTCEEGAKPTGSGPSEMSPSALLKGKTRKRRVRTVTKKTPSWHSPDVGKEKASRAARYAQLMAAAVRRKRFLAARQLLVEVENFAAEAEKLAKRKGELLQKLECVHSLFLENRECQRIAGEAERRIARLELEDLIRDVPELRRLAIDHYSRPEE